MPKYTKYVKLCISELYFFSTIFMKRLVFNLFKLVYSQFFLLTLFRIKINLGFSHIYLGPATNVARTVFY